jgi:anti-sigma factor RsiW
MTCRQCRRLLSPYLDNALEADERSNVLAHLAQCSACAERLHQFESNRQLLRALPTAEVSRGMELLLQSRIQRFAESRVPSPESRVQNSASAIRPWWRGWGAVSAGILATCAASVFFFFSNIHTPPPVSAEEVVGSMEELITVLDSDDAVPVMYEGSEDEAAPDWREDLDRWPAGDGSDLRRW